MRKRHEENSPSTSRDGLSNDPFIKSVIQRKVRHVISVSSFDQHDREDLEQEIYIRVAKSVEQFDEKVGHLYPFICTLVQRHLSKLVRNRGRYKRGPSRIGSLSLIVTLPDGGETELSQLIGEDDRNRRLGRESRLSEQDLTDLQIDLSQEIAKLPEHWRHLLQRRQTQSMSEIARDLGVPRTTLNDWMRHIRSRFEAVGLDKYLES